MFPGDPDAAGPGPALRALRLISTGISGIQERTAQRKSFPGLNSHGSVGKVKTEKSWRVDGLCCPPQLSFDRED